MRIAIIGAGNVGGTLAGKWAAKGHAIAIGARDAGKPGTRALAQSLGATVATPSEACRDADVVVLATPWPAAEAAVRSCGDVSGKVLVDCTNPLKPDLSGLAIGGNDSGGEQVQRWAQGARVVKAFNTTGFNVMADPVLEGRRAVMFYAGDDEFARATVRGLVADVGFEPADAGPLASARLLEPMALLWIQSAYQRGWGREFAFGVLRRS